MDSSSLGCKNACTSLSITYKTPPEKWTLGLTCLVNFHGFFYKPVMDFETFWKSLEIWEIFFFFFAKAQAVEGILRKSKHHKVVFPC